MLAARPTSARSPREALDRYRELNLIYDLAERIAASPHVADVTAVAVAETGRLPTGGVGFLLLESPRRGSCTPHPIGEVERALPRAAHHGGPARRGVRRRSRDRQRGRSDPRAGAAERGIASLIAAPLKVEGVRLGVIGTASKEPLEFQAGDLKILTAIAALTAPAVSQAQRYKSVVRGDE